MSEELAQRMRTPKFRVLYETAIRGQQNDQGNTTYSVDAHIPHPKRITDEKVKAETTAYLKWLKAAVSHMMENDPKIAKIPNGQLLNPIRRGDDPTFAKYEGVEAEDYCIRLKSNDPIGVVGPVRGANGKFPRLDETDVYAGMFGRSTTHLYAYNNKSKGVSIGCSTMQKVADGDPLGRGNPDADYDDVDVEDPDIDELEAATGDLDDALDDDDI